MTVFRRNYCRINTTEPNQMILASFFSEDNVLYDEIKTCYIFEYQRNDNRAFPLLGDTRYIRGGLWIKLANKLPLLPIRNQAIKNLNSRGQILHPWPLLSDHAIPKVCTRMTLLKLSKCDVLWMPCRKNVNLFNDRSGYVGYGNFLLTGIVLSDARLITEQGKMYDCSAWSNEKTGGNSFSRTSLYDLQWPTMYTYLQ